MSSLSYCVVDTIVRSTAVAMKLNGGGGKAGIDPNVSARALWIQSHPLPPAPERFG
jgi:hypothetical protein